MRSLSKLAVWFLASSFSVYAQATTNPTSPVHFDGEGAREAYTALNGPGVKQEGAAGHQYKTGKSIACSYASADMDDEDGNKIAPDDPSRYVCGMKMDKNGLAIPDTGF